MTYRRSLAVQYLMTSPTDQSQTSSAVLLSLIGRCRSRGCRRCDAEHRADSQEEFPQDSAQFRLEVETHHLTEQRVVVGGVGSELRAGGATGQVRGTRRARGGGGSGANTYASKTC